jgi:rare lipoprotein A
MRMRSKVSIAVVLSATLLAGCASHHVTGGRHASRDPFAGTGSPYYPGKGRIPLGGGRYQVGNAYQVAGVWFSPHEQPGYDKKGRASWYGEAFNRRRTSNGEYFDMTQLTAAHATLPLPSYAKVTNLENGRQVIVRINDRGPFVGTRVIDLSKRAADELGYRSQGTTNVRVQYIGPAPLNDFDSSHLMAMNRELGNGTPLRQMIASADGAPRSVAAAQPVQVARQTIVPKQPAPVGAYYVQVASFADPANVDRAESELSNVGPVQVTEVDGTYGSIYRLRVGPLQDAEEAQSVLAQVVENGHPDARIVVQGDQTAEKLPRKVVVTPAGG